MIMTMLDDIATYGHFHEHWPCLYVQSDLGCSTFTEKVSDIYS